MFQSRWGFHPCDYATYRKLKFLHHVYLLSLRRARVWERWHRKDPHNRVMRRRIRNDKGQTIGYEPSIPRPEPELCPVFSQKMLAKRYVDKRGTYFREGYLEDKVITDDLGILADYAAARNPGKEIGAVQPLRMSLETIDALHEQARQWLAERGVK
jgi:hypothetical protein